MTAAIYFDNPMSRKIFAEHECQHGPLAVCHTNKLPQENAQLQSKLNQVMESGDLSASDRWLVLLYCCQGPPHGNSLVEAPNTHGDPWLMTTSRL